MDRRNWCGSDSRTIQLGRRYQYHVAEPASIPTHSAASNKVKWKVLWVKLKKEKKKIFYSPAASLKIPYDPHTYSQNFDQGCGSWGEPDDLSSRSFSMRFADPSNIFLKKESMV